MAGADYNPRDKRYGETDLQWRSRVARLDAHERDKAEPLVPIEAARHGDYRDADVMHVETQTIAVTKRNMQASPLELMHARAGITKEQLEAGQQIELAHSIIIGGVSVRGASLEARVDNSGAGRDILIERLAMVRLETIYGRWRNRLPMPQRMFIDMLTGSQPLFTVARAYGMGWPKARRQLIKALDVWIWISDRVAQQIDASDVENAQKRIGGGVVL